MLTEWSTKDANNITTAKQMVGYHLYWPTAHLHQLLTVQYWLPWVIVIQYNYIHFVLWAGSDQIALNSWNLMFFSCCLIYKYDIWISLNLFTWCQKYGKCKVVATYTLFFTKPWWMAMVETRVLEAQEGIWPCHGRDEKQKRTLLCTWEMRLNMSCYQQISLRRTERNLQQLLTISTFF